MALESSTRRQSVDTAPLEQLSVPGVVILPFVPVLATVVTIAIGHGLAMGDDPGFPPQFPNLPLAIAGVAVIAWLAHRLDRRAWAAAAPCRRPARGELVAGLLCGLLAIPIVIGFNRLAVSVGATPHDPGQIETTLGLVSVLLGSVLVAPIAEEIRFRGLLFGHLLARTGRLLLAGFVSVVLFGLMHAAIAGLSSVVLTSILGGVLLWLRVRYQNLAGAWLAHLVVNAWAFALALGVFAPLW